MNWCVGALPTATLIKSRVASLEKRKLKSCRANQKKSSAYKESNCSSSKP